MFLSKVTVYTAAVCKLPHQMCGGIAIELCPYSTELAAEMEQQKHQYSSELHSQGASTNVLTSQAPNKVLKLPVYN